ncbi:MAG: hypothetical protein ACTSRR_13425 [Candidatus Heimdallarchaeaceae archaeon]
MDEVIIEWLLNSNPWTTYNTRLHLIGNSSDFDISETKEQMLKHPRVIKIVQEVCNWPGPILKRHNDSSHLLHKLVFLADIGLDKSDEVISKCIAKKIFSYQSDTGPFQIKVNISPNYGGTGADQLVWMSCDYPLIIYSLAKFGYNDAPQVLKASSYLVSLVENNGWRCKVDPSLGKFRGPGRKTDPCPYATLISIKALSLISKYKNSSSVRLGVETLLSLWEQRKERRPYLFAMGSGFLKLKAPLIWYDILHLLSVLVKFDWVKKDERFIELFDIIKQKASPFGKYYAESVWREWKDWDFGQKKKPSSWITYLVYLIEKQFNS